jgi:hypothetical protein
VFPPLEEEVLLPEDELPTLEEEAPPLEDELPATEEDDVPTPDKDKPFSTELLLGFSPEPVPESEPQEEKNQKATAIMERVNLNLFIVFLL